MFHSIKFVIFVIFILVSTGYSAPVEEEPHTVEEEPHTVKEEPHTIEEEPRTTEKELQTIEEEPDPSSYLAQFGYLPAVEPGSPSKLISNEDLANAIREFQKFMGIEETGELNNETKVQMKKPRCGIKDKPTKKTEGLNEYSLLNSRWKRRTLSYMITRYPARFPRGQTDKTIQEAFDTWSRVTPLKFVRKTRGPVHIEIKFVRGNHGDGDAFDGPQGVLAHALAPISGGDVHFDDSEHWTINDYDGINLLQTAAHEIGHALGLDHSRYRNALMYPQLQGYDPNFELSSDDIRGIQRLYPR